MIQTAEFAEFLENAEIRCATEFDGSDLFKWICILVCMSLAINGNFILIKSSETCWRSF